MWNFISPKHEASLHRLKLSNLFKACVRKREQAWVLKNLTFSNTSMCIFCRQELFYWRLIPVACPDVFRYFLNVMNTQTCLGTFWMVWGPKKMHSKTFFQYFFDAMHILYKNKLNSLWILVKQKSCQMIQVCFPKGIRYWNIWTYSYSFCFFCTTVIRFEHTNFQKTIWPIIIWMQHYNHINSYKFIQN